MKTDNSGKLPSETHNKLDEMEGVKWGVVENFGTNDPYCYFYGSEGAIRWLYSAVARMKRLEDEVFRLCPYCDKSGGLTEVCAKHGEILRGGDE